MDCTLDYEHAWQLLVEVRLAAQCTDARVNVVVQDLFAKYPNVAALAAAEPEEIEEIVRPCGLGRSKARDISACMRMLRDKYDCNVPDDFDALLELPGVGRKSANLIMGDVFGMPAIVTDTHCIRLCNRIGLVDNIKEPKKVEMALWKIIPPQEGSDFCHRLVDHGRAVCTARTTPYCERCCLRDVCRYAHEERQSGLNQGTHHITPRLLFACFFIKHLVFGFGVCYNKSTTFAACTGTHRKVGTRLWQPNTPTAPPAWAAY